MNNQTQSSQEQPQNQSALGIIVHSFFVIPFLIAVFAILLFVAVRLLTLEKHTVYDYLNDVKVGSLNKRWQAAFELSKILANPSLIPQEERFTAEMMNAFEASRSDDPRVRQYLALAMGRTGNPVFVRPIIEVLPQEKEENLFALIYALGMLRSPPANDVLYPFLNHGNPKVRLATVIALGNIGHEKSLSFLKKALHDPEPNVKWDAAIALAKMKDLAGKSVLLNLLHREYLTEFPEVDLHERDHIIMVVIEVAKDLHDPDIAKAMTYLSKNDANMDIRKAAMAALNSQ